MRLNNDSYNYRLPKLTLKRFNRTRQYSILINKLAAAIDKRSFIYAAAKQLA